jgi:copper chaperone
VSTTATFGATGLTCEHCVKAVADELAELPAVREVFVDLVAGGTSAVHVTSDEPLDCAQVREAVEEAGYTLADLL